MVDDKNFTEYNDNQLDDWFVTHIKGWSGHAIGPKENFQVVIAEMQRRHTRTQKEGTEKVINLTDKLVILTDKLVDLTIKLKLLNYVLIALTSISLLILIFK